MNLTVSYLEAQLNLALGANTESLAFFAANGFVITQFLLPLYLNQAAQLANFQSSVSDFQSQQVTWQRDFQTIANLVNTTLSAEDALAQAISIANSALPQFNYSQGG